ncbi:hypothetical protein GGR07_000802 [Bacteroides pyogenes]|nr:hypothetical protein [Bacteroides pyogenes]SUV32383.1 Uncharacterised protein [Bacteroides pyogenes]
MVFKRFYTFSSESLKATLLYLRIHTDVMDIW